MNDGWFLLYEVISIQEKIPHNQYCLMITLYKTLKLIILKYAYDVIRALIQYLFIIFSLTVTDYAHYERLNV